MLELTWLSKLCRDLYADVYREQMLKHHRQKVCNAAVARPKPCGRMQRADEYMDESLQIV